MVNHESTRAIVLHTRPLREIDLLVTLYSYDHGKMTGVAPAARKSRKRFGGALEPGTVAQVQYTSKPNRDLVSLSECKVHTRPPGQSMKMAAFAAYGIILNVVELMSMEMQQGTDKFLVLEQAMQGLTQDDPKRVTTHFLLHWLRCAGFAPQLHACTQCTRPSVGDMWFIPERGGCLCGQCPRGQAWGMRCSESDRFLWQALSSAEHSIEAPQVQASDALIRTGLWQYVLHVIDRPLRSAPFWDMLWSEE